MPRKTTSRATKADAQTQPMVRLAAPEEALNELGLDLGTWKVLTESIFPSARTPEGILLAVRYCQARNLDVMRRPVHVVPMWSKAVGREIETVWPGIAEVQTTAARTGQWAGMDAPRFGPDTTRTFRGRARTEEGWQDIEITVSFPAWCEVTVYRVVQGTRCPFTEPVFWEEAYSRAGGVRSEVPTDMWVKRPRGQLLKCAKAASLRAAFPEEADYTAEEMAGKVIEADGLPVPGGAPASGSGLASDPVAVERAADATKIDMEAAIEEEVREQVARLVARADKAGAWSQAEDYCRARFQGPHLVFALAELEQARAATNQEPVEQAA